MLKKLLRLLKSQCFRHKYMLQTCLHGKRNVTAGKTPKCLYVSPVGRNGKELLIKIMQKFGNENFDYLIFSYDDTKFDEPIFRNCQVIHEKGLRWEFMKKYVTPAYCEKYDYIFAWADDIDIEGFSIDKFLDIFIRNSLEMAQPALSKDSFYSHRLTLKKEGYRIGRFTDFVEIMVPVFERKAWIKFWKKIKSDSSGWGWGYDLFARSMCGFKRMGIIDSEPVLHTRPLRETDPGTKAEFENFLKINDSIHTRSLMLSYGKLK